MTLKSSLRAGQGTVVLTEQNFKEAPPEIVKDSGGDQQYMFVLLNVSSEIVKTKRTLSETVKEKQFMGTDE